MSEPLLMQILEELRSVKEMQQTMQGTQEAMQGRMDAMQETQELMQIQLKETNQIVSAILNRQDETDAKLDSMAMDIHKLRGDVTELKEGQERQDRILELLSVRSLDQETQLSALKRVK